MRRSYTRCSVRDASIRIIVGVPRISITPGVLWVGLYIPPAMRAEILQLHFGYLVKCRSDRRNLFGVTVRWVLVSHITIVTLISGRVISWVVTPRNLLVIVIIPTTSWFLITTPIGVPIGSITHWIRRVRVRLRSFRIILYGCSANMTECFNPIIYCKNVFPIFQHFMNGSYNRRNSFINFLLSNSIIYFWNTKVITKAGNWV